MSSFCRPSIWSWDQSCQTIINLLRHREPEAYPYATVGQHVTTVCFPSSVVPTEQHLCGHAFPVTRSPRGGHSDAAGHLRFASAPAPPALMPLSYSQATVRFPLALPVSPAVQPSDLDRELQTPPRRRAATSSSSTGGSHRRSRPRSSR
jgi:hypothetical protein